MNGTADYELQRVARDRVSIVLRGELLEAAVTRLQHDVARLLVGLPSDSGVIFDLGAVVRCEPAACRRLATLQRRLRAHGCRTAWLAERPQLQGMAWWIVSAARDPHAIPVEDEPAAQAWLTAAEERRDETIHGLAQPGSVSP